MQAKIENLKAKNSNDEEYIVYPRTLIKCVTNEKGDNLQDLISDTILEADGRVYVDYGSHEETDEYVPVNADTLDGQEASYYATAKSVSDITDGTTVVKEATKATFDGQNNNIFDTYLPKTGTASDSAKLGGKGASEYALKTTVNGVEIGNGGSATVYSPSELPQVIESLSTEGWYRIAELSNISAVSFMINIARAWANTPPENYNILFSGGYGTNNKFIQIGTCIHTQLFTKVRCVSDDSTHRYIEIYYAGSTGNGVSISITNIILNPGGSIVSTSLTAGEIPDGYTATEFELSSSPIKASGAELNGDYFNLLKLFRNIEGSACGIEFATASGGLGRLGFEYNGKLSRWTYDGTQVYTILDTGNKPTGSYTGNGSATERKIDTKGIDHAIIIRTNGSFSIVSPQGAIIASSSGVTYVDGSTATFANGVLILKTDNASLNANGVSYSYQVL